MRKTFYSLKVGPFLKDRTRSVLLLVMALLFANTSFAQLNYTFSNSTRAYEEVVPDVIVFDGTTDEVDDEISNDYSIGFPLNFGGDIDTNFRVSSNGYLTILSNGSGVSFAYGATLSSTFPANARIIAAHDQDLHSYGTGVCGIKYLGTAPNRITVIQWKNWQRFGQEGNFNMNFQVRLYEGSNRIELCYGANTTTTTNTYTARVGIRVGENTNVIALNSTTTWAEAVANPTNTNGMPISATVMPDSSRLYSFTPIPPATNDIAIGRISNFPTGALCDTSTIGFNVQIRNTGTAELTPVVLVELLRNGTLVTTVPYNGAPVSGGMSQLACFSGLALQGLGNYSIRIVNLTTDDVDVNDTVIQNFVVNRNCGVGGYSVAQSSATYTPLVTSTSPLPGIFNFSGTVTLPFTFVYNGQPYTQVTIQSNGLVIPGSTPVFTGALPLSNFRGNNIISAFGDDLDNLFNFDETDAYRVQYAIVGEAPNRSLVAQFTDLYTPTFLAPPVPDSSTFSFQVIINENQTIGFHYGNMFANNTSLRPVQIGLNMGNDSTFYHLNFANPCSPSYANLVNAENISNAAAYGDTLLPANGTLITFTPPAITTTDLAIGNVSGIPTGTQNCDSAGITVSALISNVSSLPITGVAVNAYVVNVTNNDTIQTVTEVITTELTAFANAPVVFNNLRLNGAGTYRIILSLINTDANLSNNTFTSADFVAIVCTPFPYTFSRGNEPFVPIDVADETVLIAGPDDDGGFGPFNLPFPVLVGSNIQTQYSVGSNGGLAFGTAGAGSGGLLGFTDNSIAALGYDAYIRGGTSYVRSATIGTAPNRVHIVEWTGQGSFGGADRDANNTFQIRIAESGEITIHYGSVGPMIGNYTPQVGFRLTSEVYNIRRMFTGDTSWTNAGASVLGSTMQLNANAFPRNGFFYRWTPPVRTGADFAVNGFISNVSNNFCDSNTVVVSALISNISSTPSTGVIVVGEIVNTVTNTVVASQEVVITDEIPAFGVDTAFFANFVIPGPGTYALRARILNVDDDTTNNSRTSGNFTVITCVPFPYFFAQGTADYIRLDSTTATRVSPELGSDDGTFGPFAMPFPVMYGANAYDQISISANGQIRFGGAAGGYTFANNNSIAAITYDLFVRGGASAVYTDTVGEFPNRTFVIEWRNVGSYAANDRNTDMNFQIRINEEGVITLHYGQFGTSVGSYTPQAGLFLSNLQYNVRTMLVGGTDWAINQPATATNGAMILNPTTRPAEGFFFQFTPRPTGVDPEVGGSVAGSVVNVCPVQTVPLSVTLTSNSAFPIARGTVTATVSTPSGGSSTFSQIFSNIVTNGGTFTVSLGNIEVSEVGAYNVSYAIQTINDGVASNDFANLTINGNGPDAAPTVTNLTGINTICGTTPVTLQAPDGAVEYLWSNGATTREISVASRGSFTVQTRSATGCLSLPSTAIEIDSAATTAVSFTTTTDRLNVIVNGASVGASSVGYFWTGGASAGQANDTITFPAAGTYSISFYGVGVCGNDTVTQDVTVADVVTPSDASIAIEPGARTFCQNSTTTYAARATNVGTSLARLTRVVYTVTSPSNVVTSDSTDLTNVLTVGAGATFTARDLNLTEAGTYTVSVTIRAENDNVLTNNTVSENFLVQGLIDAPEISSPAATICAGGTATISASAAPAPGNSYIWSNGATTQSISVTEAGTYSLRVVNGVCTSAVSNEVVVVIDVTPAQPIIVAARPATFCAGDSTILELPMGFASYAWSNGATTRTIAVRNAGSITGTVANATGCISPVSEAVVTAINPTPNAGITATVLPGNNRLVRLQNTSEFGTSHVFTYEGGTSTAADDTIQFAADGLYTIRITTTNACGTDIDSATVQITNAKTSGIAKFVSAYPNPANNFVNVDFGTLQFSEATITMLDVTGKVVLTTTATGNTRLDIANLPASVYNVRVAVAGEVPANFSVVKR